MADLLFDAEKHEYSLNGVIVPSVTQILEDAGVIDYSFISHATREMALHRGSMVHLACQLYDERDLVESSVDPAIVPYLNAWKRFLSETGFILETDQIEKRFYNERWAYAGTRDRRGKLRGMPTVADIKTNDAPEWVRMQLAAYCEFERFPTTVGRMAVELHSDETYRAVPISIKDHQRDFNDFCCCLRTYQLKREMNSRREGRKAA
jgi:hypothetical protein